MNNNNRGNNNRRRGRGNNNRPQGGGQQLNRIDSRARGNAPQMLEKYRKLAQDAHLNGDRVQAEYYLQFADHYFRVIADSRVRVDEQRQRQPGERWSEQDAEDEAMEFGMDADFPAFDRPHNRRDEQREPRESREPRDNREPREPREQREPRDNREPREPYRPRSEPVAEAAAPEPMRADEGEPISETSDNPFVREPRSQRGLRPRGERRARREADEAPAATLDTILPPAIGIRSAVETEAPQAETGTADDAPAPKRRGRPRKNPLPEAATEAAEG